MERAANLSYEELERSFHVPDEDALQDDVDAVRARRAGAGLSSRAAAPGGGWPVSE